MDNNKAPKKNKISYWNSIFSISTVLFLTGFIGIFIWIAKSTSDVLKESVSIQVELVDTTQSLYDKLKTEFEAIKEVKSVKFTTKDSAAAKLRREINEDFVNIIGYNPLFNSFDINLKSEFFNADALEKTKNFILKNSLVRSADYPKVVSKSLDRNLKKITIGLASVTALLLIIAIVLIDSTIKLAMFSDRFLIKSMQLVGATRWFIIRPYMGRAIINGIFSAFIASGLLILLLKLISNFTDLIDIKKELKTLAIIFFGLILLGIIISSISSFLAVSKYLRSKLDSLY